MSLLVAMAVFMGKSSTKIIVGTFIIPPPIPAVDEIKPATRNMVAVIKYRMTPLLTGDLGLDSFLDLNKIKGCKKN